MPATLAELRAICGEVYARVGGPVDTVSGVPAQWVVAPATAEAVSALLKLATGAGLTVVASGAGTKLDWAGPPSKVDILLDTGRLAGLRHGPGDPVVTVGAGTPVRAVQAALARASRRLSLDPGSPSATIGGVLAVCEAGPLRLAYGTCDDLLVSATFVRADGVIVSTGGEVTVDAAVRGPQPELASLLCGSYGTLGVIISVKMVVHPPPSVQTWVLHPVRSPLEMRDQLLSLLSGGLAPSAIEVDLPAGSKRGEPGQGPRPATRAGTGTLGLLLEGSAADVALRVHEAVALLGTRASVVGTPPWWWGSYPFGPADVALRLAGQAADLHAGVYSLRDATAVPVAIRGSAGAGVLYAALPGSLPPRVVASAVVAVHATLGSRGGSCLVLSAPPGVHKEVDLWGMFPVPSHLRQAKEQLDPGYTLAPGRAPAGC